MEHVKQNVPSKFLFQSLLPFGECVTFMSTACFERASSFKVHKTSIQLLEHALKGLVPLRSAK